MGCCWGQEKEEPLGKWDVKSKKSCTDIYCLIIFVIYIGAMACISVYAISAGGADRIIYGTDSYGNVCGKNNSGRGIGDHKYHGLDMSFKPYVFFFDFIAETAELASQDLPNSHSLEACVHKCPDGVYEEGTKDPAGYLVQEYQNGNNLCFLNYDLKEKDFEADSIKKAPAGKDKVCPKLPVTDHVAVFQRCFPKSLGAAASTVTEFFNNIPTVEKVAIDLYSSRYTLLYTSLISIAISIISVVLLRFLASILVWVVIGGLSLSSLAATVLMWYSYAINQGVTDNEINALDQVVNTLSSHDDILFFAIGVTIFSFLMILFCIVAVKRAKLAAALFGEAGKTISKIPWILVQGVWMYIALISIWSIWALSLAFLVSSGEMSVDKTTGYVSTTNNKELWWAYLIQVFGVIWLTEVVFACHQFVLSAAVASYYFTRNKRNFDRESPLLGAFLQLITYHLGSICLGSLLVAILRIPQAICAYIYHKSKQAENKLAQCLSKACMCCLCCFEKCLRFFNATSYAMIAITGQNYCGSACMGAATIASNAFRVGAIAVVGGLTLFLGKVLIAVLSGIIAGVFVKTIPDHPELNSIIIPVTAAAIIGYVIAAGFYATFSTAVDTLLLCFCEDVRVNDGTENKPYFMDKSLMIFLQFADSKMASKGESEESEPLRTM